jgi:hypothetical protein
VECGFALQQVTKCPAAYQSSIPSLSSCCSFSSHPVSENQCDKDELSLGDIEEQADLRVANEELHEGHDCPAANPKWGVWLENTEGSANSSLGSAFGSEQSLFKNSSDGDNGGGGGSKRSTIERLKDLLHERRATDKSILEKYVHELSEAEGLELGPVAPNHDDGSCHRSTSIRQLVPSDQESKFPPAQSPYNKGE